MSLCTIIYEHINDTYSYGKYGEFNVIMITSNCYINATKLCKLQDKRFDNWLQNESSKDLINEVNKEIQLDPPGIPGGSESIKIVISGNKILYGTYVHPLLIPHIASWISSTFAIKVSRIVNDFMTRHLRNENSELSKQINDLVISNNTLVIENKEQTRLMKLQHLESQNSIKELLNINQDIKEDTSAILGISLEEAEKKEIAELKLVSATDKSINVPILSKQEYLIIFKEKTGEFYYARGLFNYISGVCLKKCGTSLASIIKDEVAKAKAEAEGKEVKEKHYKNKESEYLKYYKYIPNARHLIQVVMENLVSDIIKTSANTIKFRMPVTNEYFIKYIHDVYKQRLTVPVSLSDTDTAKSKAKTTLRIYKPKSKITKTMIDTLV